MIIPQIFEELFEFMVCRGMHREFGLLFQVVVDGFGDVGVRRQNFLHLLEAFGLVVASLPPNKHSLQLPESLRGGLPQPLEELLEDLFSQLGVERFLSFRSSTTTHFNSD